MKEGLPQPNTRAKLLDKEKRVLFMSKIRRCPILCSTGTLRFYRIATVNQHPSTINRQPALVNRQPSAVNRQPSTSNIRPEDSL